MTITSSSFLQILFLAWSFFFQFFDLDILSFVFQSVLTVFLFQFINALMENCDEIAGGLCSLRLWIGLFF